jgi:hypothetical protein
MEKGAASNSGTRNYKQEPYFSIKCYESQTPAQHQPALVNPSPTAHV